MEDAFQHLTLGGFGKYTFPHRRPVQAAIGGHDAGAEGCRDIRHRETSRASQFMGNVVGINNAGAQFGKQRRSTRFAGTDAAGDADAVRHQRGPR